MIHAGSEKIQEVSDAEIQELLDRDAEKTAQITGQHPAVSVKRKGTLISGDSHADVGYLQELARAADEYNVARIFVVGDFGFWPRTDFGRTFLEQVAKVEIPVYFLAGNHDCYQSIEEILEDWHVIDDQGFILLSDNCWYAPRGHQWEWDGLRFGALGGAFSIDRDRRVKYVSWFPEEVLSEADVEHALQFGEVDIMLTHDAPQEADLPAAYISMGYQNQFWEHPETELNREKLSRVARAWKPKMLFHGHWHLGYSQRVRMDYGELRVIGLDCNGSSNSYTIVGKDNKI